MAFHSSVKYLVQRQQFILSLARFQDNKNEGGRKEEIIYKKQIQNYLSWAGLSFQRKHSYLPGKVGTLTDRLFETIQKPVLYLLAPICYLSLSYRHSVENEHSTFLGCDTDPFWTTSHNVLSSSDEDTVAST